MATRRSVTDRFCGGSLWAGVAAATLVLGLPGPAAWAQQERLDVLNRPMQQVGESNQSYRVYFDASMKLDLADAGLPVDFPSRMVGTPAFEAALAWAGAGPQQEAVSTLLDRGPRGNNATQRELFGLPYGTQAVPQELMLNDFVVYVSPDNLAAADFAYLPTYTLLMRLLDAEAHRRIAEGDSAGAVEALMGMVGMARQLVDREYYEEKEHGIRATIDAMEIVRDFMWRYRTPLTLTDYTSIARELERLRVERVQLPRADMQIGQQLIDETFGPDLRPKPDVFANRLAGFETREEPLKRFEAAAKWKGLTDRHATRNETASQLQNILEDWNRRWNLPLHDPALEGVDPAYKGMDRVKFALVDSIAARVERLFDLRVGLYAAVRGTATAAGVAAFQEREGWRERSAPRSLSQVQPAYVPSERTLVDPFTLTSERFRYGVITNNDRTRPTFSYTVRTPGGSVEIPEHWPLLYSIGPDGVDDNGAMHTGDFIDGVGDVILWPNVELMATEGLMPEDVEP